MKHTKNVPSKMHRILMLQEVVPVVIAEILVHYFATQKKTQKFRGRMNSTYYQLF